MTDGEWRMANGEWRIGMPDGGSGSWSSERAAPVPIRHSPSVIRHRADRPREGSVRGRGPASLRLRGRGDALEDLGIGVGVQLVVGDLAPVGGEVELGGVVLVVAADAEPGLVGGLGGAGDRLAVLEVLGVLGVLGRRAVAVL